ncbi:MAG TPA: hypothetical protein VFF55_08490, partial [Candidatus Deferrimicrobium sp.]|nr:hypothetical protein [Candidatus Deferrimicrobium sp.]
GIVTELAPVEGRLVVDPLALDLPAPRAPREDLPRPEPEPEPDAADPAPAPDSDPAYQAHPASALSDRADPELDPTDPAQAAAG